MVAPLQQKLTAREMQEKEQQEKEQLEAIDKFVASPDNPYAGEVLEDMTRLIAGGLASSLQEAYGMAVRLNPTVSDKIRQAEIEKVTKLPQRPPRNVRSGSTPPASTNPNAGEDIDATMKRVYEEINSR